MRKLRSIGAVLAGLVLPFILALATDTILESSGIFPSVEYQQEHGFDTLWMNLLALFYRLIFTILGGVATAKLAPNRPMRHAVILAVIGTIVAIISNIAVQLIVEATADVLPLWFSVALVLIVFPGTWLGGKLATQSQDHG